MSEDFQDEAPIQEVALQTDEVVQLSKEDMDFLCAVCMPATFRYCFPPVFRAVWEWLLSYVHKTRDFSKLALGLPRGFGKTMVIKLFVVYCILFTKKQFILIICGTQTKANNMITDITAVLDEPNVKKSFGDWRLGIGTDRQDMKTMGFRGRNIVLMGAGAGADIRGITLGQNRPDVMIFDDIQTQQESESEVVSTNLETWFQGTALKAKSPEGCLSIFVANMYATKFSLLRKLKYNPTWFKFIAGGILSDGSSLWEELHPIEQLLAEYESDLAAGRPEIFFAEVLNDEHATVNRHIDISKVPHPEIVPEDLHQGNFIIIDPATDKVGSDLVAIGYFELFDGVPLLKDLANDRLSPGEISQTAIKMALKHQCRLIVVESVAFQYVMGWILKQDLNRYGIQGIEVVDIYPGSKSKNSRILTMFLQLLKGEVLLGEDVRAQVLAQVSTFNPLKTKNQDDILDLLCYAPRVVEHYGEFIASSLVLEAQEFAEIPLRSAIETSSF